MKRMLFAGAVALALATPAFAADLPQAAPPPPQAPAFIPPPPVYNWSGVYIGINGGYAFGNSDWNAPASTGNFALDGGLVGGTLGINFQSGQFVFGLEGDIDWADISGSTNNAVSAVCFGAGAPCTFQTQNDWLSTFRARVGVAFDRVLLYGTAGGAAGDVKANFTNPNIAGSLSTSSTEFGWSAGAGLEYAITENVTIRGEYLFVDLSNASFGCTAALCGGAGTVPVSFNTSLVRAGLDFKFNPF
jgi:outer membrane immunogenic protein